MMYRPSFLRMVRLGGGRQQLDDTLDMLLLLSRDGACGHFIIGLGMYVPGEGWGDSVREELLDE